MSKVYTKENTIALDGVGIIYPYVATERMMNNYRIHSSVEGEVSVPALKKAVQEMYEAYPYFFHHLVKVGKEYRLAPSDTCDVVIPDNGLCKPFDKYGDKPLVRVLYSKNNIEFEMHHCLAGGTGAREFFMELLKRYKHNLELETPEIDTDPVPENKFLTKNIDFYKEIYKLGGKSVGRPFITALRLGKGEERIPLHYNILTAEPSVLSKAAKSYGVTVTVFLCALQIRAIAAAYPEQKRVIRISVPVEIMKFFESDGIESSRNSSLYFYVEHKPKSGMSFEELLQSVTKQFKENLTKEKMQNLAYTNVKDANSLIFRIIPVWMKKIVLGIGHRIFGGNLSTSTITNLGIMKMPEELNGFVKEMYFILGEEKVNPLNFTVTSFGGVCRIAVSSCVDSSKFISAFSKELSEHGVAVTLED